ncbi:DUF1223 domain-containing protein [Pseudooceanicola sp. 216_PA32_1]|uniref:DUF1223 domain-containing protein n=2 Tax=Pseudooceanicola pacificus TaxID=2676438 RepID=A0A844W2H9_9RHOB|nr:DUF1223 domain-containing protein [Pseudooceanicola pacificus]
MAQAEDRGPIVVELYTSQGCSSCPPADAFLSTLAARDDVIALALHVDYWDYIGWKDEFGSPAFSHRQKNYARFAGRRSVYTPQMVIQGQDDVVGTHPMDVADLILKHRDTEPGVALALQRAGNGRIQIDARALRTFSGPLVVQIVRYLPSASVEILRGENAGRTVAYSNIVTEWKPLAEWDTSKPLKIAADVPGEQPVVVLIQQKGPGAIEAAARLR